MTSKIPDLTPISSSMFSGHHYDPATRRMHVQYKSGAVYAIDDVPMEKVEAFSGALSPGRYFNERIKPNYVSRKVSE